MVYNKRMNGAIYDLFLFLFLLFLFLEVIDLDSGLTS